VELAIGLLLLAAATVAGMLLKQHPWPNRLDVYGIRIARDVSRHWAKQIVHLGSDRALVIGVIVLCAVALLRRDWVRAVACVVAPLAAVIVVELVAKPLVGRTFADSGALSYPSGTVTVIACLAAGALLVAPGIVKLPVGLIGAAAVAAVSVAVLTLHWHYLTDSLGGVCIGYGAVFAIDSIGHISVRALTPPHRRGLAAS
jgi:type IV secretory pathway TrbD component